MSLLMSQSIWADFQYDMLSHQSMRQEKAVLNRNIGDGL